MIEVENTDVNIVRNLIPMRNHMPASAYGLKAISDWFAKKLPSSESLCFSHSLLIFSSNPFINFIQVLFPIFIFFPVSIMIVSCF